MENCNNERNDNILDQVVSHNTGTCWLHKVSDDNTNQKISPKLQKTCWQLPLQLFSMCKDPLQRGDLTNTPWYEVAIHLIGLWSAKTEHFNAKFYSLTCIDTWHYNQLSRTCMYWHQMKWCRKFKQTWSGTYPTQVQVVQDSGFKFTGCIFSHLLCVCKSRMFLQPVKIYSLMSYAKACISNHAEDITLIATTSNLQCWWLTFHYNTFH